MTARQKVQKLSFKAPSGGGTAGELAGRELEAHGLPRGLARAAFFKGMLYVNGRRATTMSMPLKGGETIDMYIERDTIDARAAQAQATPDKLRILYEDEAIICFDKPAGVPTQPTVDAKRANLYDLAKAQLGGSYLGMHHRLDRDTSGVILFTKEQKYNKHIADEFSNHTCSKVYTALVHGRIPRPTGRLESFQAALGKLGPKKIQKYGSVKSGGKKAITTFSVLESGAGLTLVEASIETGRTHQIRVHLSEEGHSIVGDTLYGSPERFYHKLGRHMLHAHVLTINHPVSKNAVRIESPVPTMFRRLLGEKI